MEKIQILGSSLPREGDAGRVSQIWRSFPQLPDVLATGAIWISLMLVMGNGFYLLGVKWFGS